MSEQPNNKYFELNKNIRYTLQGTQPYVLSGQWPSYFVPSGTIINPDYSMSNITGYNENNKYALYNNYSCNK